MGRNKKKNAAPVDDDADKPFCYFCDRVFDDEDILVQHQLTKHFTCAECNIGNTGGKVKGKCNTLHGLVVHAMKVHKTELKSVPNAKPGRDDPIELMQIYGSRNVPEEAFAERRLKSGQAALPDEAKAPVAPPPVPDAAPVQHAQAMPPMQPMPMPLFPGGPTPLGAPGAVPGLPPLPGVPGSGPPQFRPSMPSVANNEGGKKNQQVKKEDWSANVAAWLAQKEQEEEEQRAQEAQMAQQAAQDAARAAAQEAQRAMRVEEQMPPMMHGQMPGMPQPVLPRPGFGGHVVPRPGFGGPGPAGQVDPSISNFLAQASETASFASVAAAVQPPAQLPGMMTQQATPAMLAQVHAAFGNVEEDQGFSGLPGSSLSGLPESAQGRQKSKSRSRGRRSRSRGRRSRSPRGGKPMQPYKPNAFDAGLADNPIDQRTIAITGGVVTTRLWLKKEMERFGRVEVCHTGNRQNPHLEPPWVRFEKAHAAEDALKAINKGQVLIDGKPIKGEVKVGGRPPPPPRSKFNQTEKDLEITSRDLRNDDRRRRPPRDSKDPLQMSSRDIAMLDRNRRNRSDSRSRSRSNRRRGRR